MPAVTPRPGSALRASEARPRVARCLLVHAPRLFALALLTAGCGPGDDGRSSVAPSPADEIAPADPALPPAPEPTSAAPPPAPGAAADPEATGAAADPSATDPSASIALGALASIAGASAAAIEPPPCPPEMALVGRFCVDRHEAHLVTEAGGALTSHPHFLRPEPGVRYLARSAPGAFPQAYISRIEAKAACDAASKRLCTRREWQRACRGKGFQRYPYGPRGQRGRCNTGKPHLLGELFGKPPRGGLRYEEHFNNPELDQRPGFLARSGEYAGCASDLGVLDMVGNLHEWVSDMVDQDLMAELAQENVERRDQPWREGNGVFMGGFFSTTSELGPGCFFATVAHEPAYHDYSTGFRCCASAALPPEPPLATKKKRAR